MELKLLTQTPCTVVKLAGRLAQIVKASAKTTSCKPLSRQYEFDSSQGQFVCLDMFVNAVADPEGLQGVRLNPRLIPNYFIIMGNFEKSRVN